MNRPARLTPERAAALLAEIGVMTQTNLAARLARGAFRVTPVSGGLLALPSGSTAGVLLVAPMPAADPVKISGGFAVGSHVTRTATIVAGLRAATPETGFLFLDRPADGADALPTCPKVSLEGGLAPSIWPGCMGSADFLIRCLGRRPRLDEPNTAVNALEAGIPILTALRAASGHIATGLRNEGHPDAPLMRRLSIIAAHGGTLGSVPSLFDVVVTRRYGPDETITLVKAEMDAIVNRAASPDLRVELTVLSDVQPVDDPGRSHWSAETRALAAGFGWPQHPFRTDPPLLPDAILFGGLDNPRCDPASRTSSVSAEEIGALITSLTTYLAQR